MKKSILTGMIAATLGLFNTANAEGMDPAALKNVYDITRNTAGLMSYCVDKGFLKAESIDNAKKMVAYVAAIPGGVDTRDGDKREAMGREGNVLNERADRAADCADEQNGRRGPAPYRRYRLSGAGAAGKHLRLQRGDSRRAPHLQPHGAFGEPLSLGFLRRHDAVVAERRQ